MTLSYYCPMLGSGRREAIHLTSLTLFASDGPLLSLKQTSLIYTPTVIAPQLDVVVNCATNCLVRKSEHLAICLFFHILQRIGEDSSIYSKKKNDFLQFYVKMCNLHSMMSKYVLRTDVLFKCKG